MMKIVHADDVTPQPWRNGGGTTRELLVWPKADDWLVRISRADIAQNGAFSSFPNVERWFTVLEGAGVILRFRNDSKKLLIGDSPICFAGDAAPFCELIDGSTEDLNLMVRNGEGFMLPVENDASPLLDTNVRGLYTTNGGTWQRNKSQISLPRHTLLWIDDADTSDWRFSSAFLDGNYSNAAAWWLGYSPAAPTIGDSA